MTHEDRTPVQTRLGVNMVVEAGAGTGKTTLLIDRLCLCVLAQGTPVEKLVALTFTEKAAAEIKTRFIFKLEQLVQAVRTHTTDRTLELLRTHFSVKEEVLVERAEAALARLDRANIGTIHGFCAEILKMFPLEAGLSPNAQIDTGYKAQTLFDGMWNQFLDVQLGVSAPRPADWKEVLKEISLEELKLFAQELSAVKPVEYDYYAQRALLVSQCAQKARRLEELYQFYVPHGKKPRNLEKALSWAANSLRRTELFLQGKEIAPAADTPCPTLSLCKDWDEADFEEARGLISFAQKVTPENQHLFLLAYDLITPLAREVCRTYLQEGVLSFDDLIIRVRNLLQQNLYVRRVLKEKFEVLFVDEFQDTDPVQGELLLFLAEEKAGMSTRWQEVQLAPGKLFVVGDPKQSIYRFRGADITAYELFTDLILKQGGEKFFLQTNFRSEPEIVQTANEVCSRAMVQQTAFQPAYVPIFTDKPARPGAVAWQFVGAPEEGKPLADDFRHNQAEQIARWIKQNVGTLLLKDGRKLAQRDIALLTRVGTTARIYTDALRRYGIAFNTEMDKDFFRKQEINDLLLLLRVLADPEDKIALAGVFRSPFGGLNDEELYEVAQTTKWEFAKLLTSPLTSPMASQLQRLHHLAGRMSVCELLQTIFQDSFFEQACAKAYEQERTLSYLQQFLALAQAYQTQQPGDLAGFLTGVQTRLMQNPESLLLPSADESADAVSVLTVHKSKGLEFPVVILADLSRKETAVAAHPVSHLFSWQYNLYGLRVGKICDVNLAFLEEEQKRHSRCEEVRILYVALTRAKEKLLLCADERTGAEKAAGYFVAAGLWPAARQTNLVCADGNLRVPVQYFPYIEPRAFIYKQVSQTRETKTPLENLGGWRSAYESRKHAYEQLLATAQHKAPSQENNDQLLSQPQAQAAELGTVCHRALELLLTRPGFSVPQACLQAAEQTGAADQAAPAEQLVAPFVASPLFAQIKACKLLACEMPFTIILPDKTPQNGIMDVVLENTQGVWVIDYKTDRVTPGAERALLEEKYRAQLADYRRAAEQIFAGKPVRVSAVFVRTFAAVEA